MTLLVVLYMDARKTDVTFVFLGILQYEVKEMLNVHIYQESFYTLDYLNQQIAGLELGYMESRDRPSLISSKTIHGTDHSLKQEGM